MPHKKEKQKQQTHPQSQQSQQSQIQPQPQKIFQANEKKELITAIQAMDKPHKCSILKFFIDNRINYTENANGTFINFDKIPNMVLIDLIQLINQFKKVEEDERKRTEMMNNEKE